jgi:chemotaxis protein MotB
LRRKRREEEHENLERWLITYADLITLLLAFFIMMYVFSKQDAQKYDEVVGHLKTIFTGGTRISGQGQDPGALLFELPIKTVQGTGEEVRKKLDDEVRSLADNESIKKNISVFSDERGVIIRVLEKAFFDEGKADLKERAKSALSKIIPIVKNVDNQVRIEGHTDNVPINNHEFRSNWELSARRATEVVSYFIEKNDFPPERISAVGYAEYRPVTINNSPENRALNRRIEIIIVKSDKDTVDGKPIINARNKGNEASIVNIDWAVNSGRTHVVNVSR